MGEETFPRELVFGPEIGSSRLRDGGRASLSRELCINKAAPPPLREDGLSPPTSQASFSHLDNGLKAEPFLPRRRIGCSGLRVPEA